MTGQSRIVFLITSVLTPPVVFGHLPWLSDLIALMPHPGPIVTYQQVRSFRSFIDWPKPLTYSHSLPLGKSGNQNKHRD